MSIINQPRPAERRPQPPEPQRLPLLLKLMVVSLAIPLFVAVLMNISLAPTKEAGPVTKAYCREAKSCITTEKSQMDEIWYSSQKVLETSPDLPKLLEDSKVHIQYLKDIFDPKNQNNRTMQVKDEFLEAADIHLQRLKDIADFSNYPETVNAIMDDFAMGVKGHAQYLVNGINHLHLMPDAKRCFTKAAKIHRQTLKDITRFDMSTETIKDVYRKKMKTDAIKQFDMIVDAHLGRLREVSCILSHDDQARHFIDMFEKASGEAYHIWKGYAQLRDSTHWQADQFLRDLFTTTSFVTWDKSQQVALVDQYKSRMEAVQRVSKFLNSTLLDNVHKQSIKGLYSEEAVQFVSKFSSCMDKKAELGSIRTSMVSWLTSGRQALEVLEAIQNVVSCQEAKAVQEHNQLFEIVWGEKPIGN